MTTVSKQDFNEWLKNPMTQVIQELMRQDRNDCFDKLLSDVLLTSPSYSLIAAKCSGMIVIYENFLNLDYDTVCQEGFGEEAKEESV